MTTSSKPLGPELLFWIIIVMLQLYGSRPLGIRRLRPGLLKVCAIPLQWPITHFSPNWFFAQAELHHDLLEHVADHALQLEPVPAQAELHHDATLEPVAPEGNLQSY